MALMSKLTSLCLFAGRNTALVNSMLGLFTAMMVGAQIGEEILDHRGITQEDIAQMDEKVDAEIADPSKQARKDWTKSADQTEDDKKLMEEWEQHMHDFVPEDITTVIVDPRREVVSGTVRITLLLMSIP